MVKQMVDKDGVYFEPVTSEFKPLAKVRYGVGTNHLAITKGSIIRLPERVYSTNDELKFYQSIEHNINEMHENGMLKDIGNREYKVLSDIVSSNPSILAVYIKGKTANGWEFFEGLGRVRASLLRRQVLDRTV